MRCKSRLRRLVQQCLCNWLYGVWLDYWDQKIVFQGKPLFSTSAHSELSWDLNRH